MSRSARAVISQLLADSVTPLLKRHGFDHRSRRNYDRVRDGRRELINVQPNEWNNRHGGSFTINLGIFIPEMDSILSLYPLQAPPEEYECQIRCRIGDVGPDGRLRDDVGAEPWRGWWEFDAQTDLSGLGAEVWGWVEHKALGFFDHLAARAQILAWARRYRMRDDQAGLWGVVLAEYASESTLAQDWLDKIVAGASPGPNRVRREAARIADRLGLSCFVPTDTPALTAVFRMAAETSPDDRRGAFYHLEYQLGEHLGQLRTRLTAEDAAGLYHTLDCTSLVGTAIFYGASPENLLGCLRPAFERVSELFADITYQANPAAPGRA